MTVRPLRQILSFQTVLVAVLPFGLTALLGAIWVFPHFKADVETPQLQIAATISSRTEGYLTAAMNVVRGIAALPLEHYLEMHDVQQILDSQRRIAGSLRSIYIVDPNGLVKAVSLQGNRRQQEMDLRGMDLSHTPLYRKVKKQGTRAWSDAFLSVVGGGISVAFAAPAGAMVVIGEIDLGLLSGYLKKISPGDQHLILVIDRKGQVIADKGGHYTAQQLNISHLPIIRQGLVAPSTQTQRFRFAGRDVSGNLVKTSFLDWHILVASDSTAAYRPMWATITVFIAALIAAILVGVLVAMVASRRLADRFEALAEHARQISAGDSPAQWPRANITELEELAGDLQQMAETIRDREAYNRVLFADASVPHTVLNPDTTELIDCNAAALRLFGAGSREELLGRTLAGLSTPIQYDGIDSTQAALRQIQTCRENGSSRFEWRHQRIDGQPRDCVVNLSRFDHGPQTLMQASVQDITRRKKAEQEVAAEKHKLEVLAAGAKGFNEILEISTILRRLVNTAIDLTGSGSGAAGLIQADKMVFSEYVENGQAQSLDYAFSKGEGTPGHVMETRQPYLTNDPDNDPYVIGTLKEKIGFVALVNVPIINSSGKFIGCLALHKHETGDRFAETDIDLLVGLTSSAAIAIDNAIALEKQKAVQEAFLESEERFRLLMQQSPAVIELYDRDGLQVAVNRAYEKLWNFAAETTVNKFNVLKSKEVEATGLMTYIRKAYAGEAAKVPPYEFDPSGDTEAKGKGRVRWLSTLVYPLKDKSGDVKNIVITHEDISEVKYAEERRKELEAQLRQAQKMESIGTLAGGIAHDFNNILAAIIGYTDLAIGDLSENDDLRYNLNQILQAGFRARDLVKQILLFSRQGEQEPLPVKLGLLVKEATKLLRASLPATIDMEVKVNTPRDTVLADATQIHQIIMNLCANAGHAMQAKGGSLTVELNEQTFSSRTTVGDTELEPGPYVVLTIIDSGNGIEPGILKRIFDPFFTTKNRGEGTGMGLSVVHGIIKNHRGAIGVTSQPGKGTTFRVFLPRLEAARTAEMVPAAHLPGGNERILLVDDETSIVDALEKRLTRQGYQVVSKTSSREALAIFKSDPESFDLIITDRTMPEMTGLELAREALHNRPDMPIILCTGFSDQLDVEKARAMGFAELMLKPVLARDLLEGIRRALEGGKG